MSSKGFIFYDNWCDMINEYYDNGDQEAAYLLSFAITRLYSTGELVELPRKDLNMMLKYSINSGIESQIRNYAAGNKGGRPSKLTSQDQLTIATSKTLGKTAKQIAEDFCVSADTIRRSDGWINSQKYAQNSMQNSMQNAKPLGTQKQNQEEEEEKEEEKKKEEKELTTERIAYLESRFLEDGADLEQNRYWLSDDKQEAFNELIEMGFNSKEANYVINHILKL